MRRTSTLRPHSSAEAPDRASERATDQGDAPRHSSTWHTIRSLEGSARRRQFLIDHRVQLRAVALTGALALTLLVLLNVTLYFARENGTAVLLTSSPELAATLAEQDRVELFVVALSSLVFLCGVMALTIFETHRTAGAAWNLARHMAAVQAGHYDIQLHLRKGDSLPDLEPAFNDMTRALQERAWASAEVLEYLAEKAEQLGSHPESAHIAERLREEAAATRRRAE